MLGQAERQAEPINSRGAKQEVHVEGFPAHCPHGLTQDVQVVPVGVVPAGQFATHELLLRNEVEEQAVQFPAIDWHAKQLEEHALHSLKFTSTNQPRGPSCTQVC